MSAPRSVSVVITTACSSTLDRRLRSLLYQTQDCFEVILVRVPGNETCLDLGIWRERVKVLSIDDTSKASARNAAVAAAAGEIILFLGEEVGAEPGWIAAHAAAYRDPAVGAAGTQVLGPSGTRSSAAPLLDTSYTPVGGARFPVWAFQSADAQTTLHVPAESSSFRRELLRSLGGFDEEIGSDLDVAEMCRRITESGHRIEFLERGATVNRLASEDLGRRSPRHAYVVVKDRFYLALSEARRRSGLLSSALSACNAFVAELLSDAEADLAESLLTLEEYERFAADVAQGARDGRHLGVEAARRSRQIGAIQEALRPFPVLRPRGAQSLCLIAPPHERADGSRAPSAALEHAKAQAALGHRVTVISPGEGRASVDFEEGVWVRTLAKAETEDRALFSPWRRLFRSAAAGAAFARSSELHREASRLHEDVAFDRIVCSPTGLEGLHCLHDRSLPTVPGLEPDEVPALDPNRFGRAAREELSILTTMVAAEAACEPRRGAANAEAGAAYLADPQPGVDDRPLRRVSIIAGIIDRYDAVSECVLANLEALDLLTVRDRLDVRIYCLFSSHDDSRIVVLRRWEDILQQSRFVRSDLVVAHFAIRSDIHRALAFVSRTCRLVVEFYGVTPPQYLPRSAEGNIAESYIQIGLFGEADEVIVQTDYLAERLCEIDPGLNLTKLPLFAINESVQAAGDRAIDRTLEVVFCGRIVPSKQVLELIEAFAVIATRTPRLRLTIIGAVNHSEQAYVAKVNARIGTLSGRAAISLRSDLRADMVARAVSEADLLVLPSLHEGFGIPVAEALLAGTPVICSDAAALREVSGGFAAVFPARDFEAFVTTLESALAARAANRVLCEQDELPYEVWAAAAAPFAARYRRATFIATRARYFGDLLRSTPPRGETLRLARSDAFSALSPPADDDTPPVDCQLAGRFAALLATSRLPISPAEAARTILRWKSIACRDGGKYASPRTEGIELPASVGAFLSFAKRATQDEGLRRRSFGWRSVSGVLSVLAAIDPSAYLERPRGVISVVPTREEADAVLKSLESDVDFVAECYRFVLGRDFDAGGLEIFTGQLEGGASRDALLDTFFASSEFQERKARSA